MRQHIRSILLLTALAGVTGCSFPWGFSHLEVLVEEGGRAQVWTDEIQRGSASGIVDSKQRHLSIAFEGSVHRDQLLDSRDGVVVLLCMYANRCPFLGVGIYSSDGTVSKVRVADGVELPAVALGLLEPGVGDAHVWNLDGVAWLLLYRSASRTWLYEIRQGQYVSARPVAVPEDSIDDFPIAIDEWVNPPIAVFRVAGEYVSTELTCDDASCAWVPQEYTFALASYPSRGARVVQTSSGEPWVVGVCPAGGCEDEGVPIVRPGGTSSIRLPEGTQWHIMEVRARRDGGVVVLIHDGRPDSSGDNGIVAVVDQDLAVRLVRIGMPSADGPEKLLLARVAGRGDVAHIVTVDYDGVRDAQVDLQTGELRVETYPLPAPDPKLDP